MLDMKAILVMLAFAAVSVAVVFVGSWSLNLQVGTRTVLEPYYSKETVAWEGNVIHEGTAYTLGFRWPPRSRVTQVQYRLKNLDSIQGRFIVGVVFDNGQVSKTVQRYVDLAPAQEATPIFNSPLPGTSTYRINVTEPSKLISREREVTIPLTLGDLVFDR